MIESIFVRQRAIAMHKQAPLLQEREDYLRHLAAEEKGRTSLQAIAMVLIHIIRVMDFTRVRQVEIAEIRQAAQRWACEKIPHRAELESKTSAPRFIRTARGWFRFHGLLIDPAQPSCHFDFALEAFIHAMRDNMELGPGTVKDSILRA